VLKNWVRQNMDSKYVPMDLLKAWHLELPPIRAKQLNMSDSERATLTLVRDTASRLHVL